MKSSKMSGKMKSPGKASPMPTKAAPAPMPGKKSAPMKTAARLMKSEMKKA